MQAKLNENGGRDDDDEALASEVEPGEQLDLDALYHSLRGQIQRRDAGRLEWLRTRSTRLRSCLALSLAGGVVIGTSALLGSRWPPANPETALVLLLCFLVWSGTVVAALRPMHLPQLSGRVTLGAGLCAFCAALVACVVPGARTVSGPADPLHCFGLGLSVAAACYLLTRALDRGSARTGWFAAVAAGLAGDLVLEAGCTSSRFSHGLGSHLPVVVLACAAYQLFAHFRNRATHGPD